MKKVKKIIGLQGRQFGALLLLNIVVLFNISYAQTLDWLWAESAGTVYSDKASDIQVGNAGNFYITGSFEKRGISLGSFYLPNNGNSDILLAKYNTDGNVIWAIGSGGVYNDAGVSMALDASENVYLSGTFASSNIIFDTDTLTNTMYAGSGDVFLAKFDSSGHELWGKTAYETARMEVSSIVTDNAGNVYAAGLFYDQISFGVDTLTSSGLSDVYIFKFDANGNEIWGRSAGGEFEDEVTSMATDGSGNIYITGNYRTSAITIGSITLPNSGDYDMFVAKYNSSGNVEWAKSAGGIYVDVSSSITLDVLGNLYFAGYYRSPEITIGAAPFTNPANYFNLFLAKFDTSGTPIWTNSAEATLSGLNDISSMITDAAGNIYMAGHFVSKSLIFGTDTLTSINNTGVASDILLSKYNTDGSLIWVTNYGGAKDEYPYSIKTDALGNLLLAGSFSSKSFFLGSHPVSNANRAGSGTDILIAKAKGTITGLRNWCLKQSPDKFSLNQNYPNPFNPSTVINYILPKDGIVNLTVYDVLGRKIRELVNDNQSAGTHSVHFNADNLSGGIYYYKLTSGTFSSTKKMLLIK